MRINLNECCAIFVDFQERLIPAIYGKEALLQSVVKLATGLSLLEVPILITEQYPKGLGSTLPEILEAAEGAPIIEKTTFGALENIEVMGHLEQLKQLGRTKVLLCGIEGHICVLQTALQLLEKGYQPIVVTDCISSRQQADLLVALMRAEREGVQFVTTEMVLFELIDSKEHPKFKAISALIK